MTAPTSTRIFFRAMTGYLMQLQRPAHPNHVIEPTPEPVMIREKALLDVATLLKHMNGATVTRKDIQGNLPQALRPRQVDHEEDQVSSNSLPLVVILNHDAQLRPVLQGGRKTMPQEGPADDTLTVPILN